MSTGTAATDANPAVRPFHVDIAEAAIVDLRRRTAAWRPPEREPVDDQSQGVQLATVQDVANYWATEYDWRRCEAKLNTLEQVHPEHGGSASDAFDVVIPSLPGYGFSGKPAATGWGPDRIARTWAVLMERLGYTRYVAQGGDWGTVISAAMARQAPEGS